MLGLMHLALHVIIYSGSGIILYKLRRRLSLIPFYIYLGILQVFTSLMSSLYVLDIGWGASVGGGSIAYAATLWAVMLLYIMERDLSEIKLVILGIVAIQFIFALLYPYYRYLLGFEGATNPLAIPPRLFDVSFGIFWVGNLLALIEMILMIFSVERMKAVFPKVPPIIHLVLVYIGTMLIDAVLYPLFAFPVTQSISIVQGLASLVSKVFLGLFYGSMLLFGAVVMRAPFANKEEKVDLDFSDMLALPKSDVVRAWQRAEQNQNRIRLLLGIISHDIRNYSSTSLGIIHLLKMNEPDMSKDIRNELNKLQRIERQSIGLLENALNLASLQEATLEIEDIRLDSAFEDAKSRLQKSYPSLSFRFTGDDALELISIKCNNLFQLALYNIFSNAAKYRKPESEEVRIDISTETDEEFIELIIADHGIGMDETQRKKVFDSLKQRPRHKEFGLFLVKSILSQCDSEIWITNRAEAPNDYTAGTAFHLRIPRA